VLPVLTISKMALAKPIPGAISTLPPISSIAMLIFFSSKNF